jgi:hypothetical protein
MRLVVFGGAVPLHVQVIALDFPGFVRGLLVYLFFEVKTSSKI